MSPWRNWSIYPAQSAEVAKLGDATALEAVGSNPVGVQLSPSALCAGRASQIIPKNYLGTACQERRSERIRGSIPLGDTTRSLLTKVYLKVNLLYAI